MGLSIFVNIRVSRCAMTHFCVTEVCQRSRSLLGLDQGCPPSTHCDLVVGIVHCYGKSWAPPQMTDLFLRPAASGDVLAQRGMEFKHRTT